MKVGLCFAGGGVKGAAHVGVLKAFEEEKIVVDYIGGTSSGSIVATLHAAGFTADEIYKIFKKYCRNIKYVDFKNILKLIAGLIVKRKITIDGLNSGKQIEKLIDKMCKKKNIKMISDIDKPLVIPSVDMNSGNLKCFTSCNFRKFFSDDIIFINQIEIGRAVRASCSYPGVFSPCPYKDTKLIDGGIRENVPWKEVKAMGADKVINIVFEGAKDKKCCSNLIEVASRSIGLLTRELSNYEMQGAGFTLNVKSEKVGLLDMNKIDEMYWLGYNIAKKNINEIKEYIK